MNFLIIGGNATGMSAAVRLRKNNPECTITVLEKGNLVSFGACGLPYFIGNEFHNPDEMIARSLESFQKSNINVLLNHEAIKINPTTNTVEAKNIRENTINNFSYDKLLISTGSTPFVPPVPGIDLKGVYTLTKMQDGIAIREELNAVKRVVVIGAGFIGLETAEAMLHQDKQVTIIEKSDRVSSRVFDSEMTSHLEEAIKNSEVTLCLNENLVELRGIDKIQQVITDKGVYNADMVIIAIGFKPATMWCNNIGLDMLSNGAIIIDDKGQTNISNIYAGGDCATVKHATYSQDSYIPLATSANKLGRILGDVLADKKSKFQGTLGTSALRFMDFEIARTGLSEHEAKSLNIEYAINYIEDFNYTSYIPNRSKIMIKLIYEQKSRILIGGQICGQKDAVLRINALAVAIFKKMTVDELGMMDFVYSPPFARTWEALNIAGNTCK